VRKAICSNNADNPAPAARTVTRNGTTYEQNVKASPAAPLRHPHAAGRPRMGTVERPRDRKDLPGIGLAGRFGSLTA
jgi:hypothetical protein